MDSTPSDCAPEHAEETVSDLSNSDSLPQLQTYSNNIDSPASTILSTLSEDTPEKSDSVVFKSTFKNILQAKKRLQAYSATKQTTAATTQSPIVKKPADEVLSEGDKGEKSPLKKTKKELYPDERAKAVIQEIEALKKEEADHNNTTCSTTFCGDHQHIGPRSRSTSLERETLQRFKKREIKCRNYRRNDSVQERRSKSLTPAEDVKKTEVKREKEKKTPPSSKKAHNPINWDEYKRLDLSFEKDREVKAKSPTKIKSGERNLMTRFLNFELPSPLIETFRFGSEKGESTVPFHFLRSTSSRPNINYSVNFRVNKFSYIKRKELYKCIPQERRDLIEKIINSSAKFPTSYKASKQRSWHPKNWFKSENTDCKVLEKSVGLSFLQSYSDEEEDDEAAGSGSKAAAVAVSDVKKNDCDVPLVKEKICGGEKNGIISFELNQNYRAMDHLREALRKRDSLRAEMEENKPKKSVKISESEGDAEESQKKAKKHRKSKKNKHKQLSDEDNCSLDEDKLKKRHKKHKNKNMKHKKEKTKRERKNSKEDLPVKESISKEEKTKKDKSLERQKSKEEDVKIESKCDEDVAKVKPKDAKEDESKKFDTPVKHVDKIVEKNRVEHHDRASASYVERKRKRSKSDSSHSKEFEAAESKKTDLKTKHDESAAVDKIDSKKIDEKVPSAVRKVDEKIDTRDIEVTNRDRKHSSSDKSESRRSLSESSHKKNENFEDLAKNSGTDKPEPCKSVPESSPKQIEKDVDTLGKSIGSEKAQPRKSLPESSPKKIENVAESLEKNSGTDKAEPRKSLSESNDTKLENDEGNLRKNSGTDKVQRKRESSHKKIENDGASLAKNSGTDKAEPRKSLSESNDTKLENVEGNLRKNSGTDKVELRKRESSHKKIENVGDPLEKTVSSTVEKVKDIENMADKSKTEASRRERRHSSTEKVKRDEASKNKSDKERQRHSSADKIHKDDKHGQQRSIETDPKKNQRRSSLSNERKSKDREDRPRKDSLDKPQKSDSRRSKDADDKKKDERKSTEKIQIKTEKDPECAVKPAEIVTIDLLKVRIKQEPFDDEKKRKRLSSDSKEGGHKKEVTINDVQEESKVLPPGGIVDIKVVKEESSPDTEEYHSNWESDDDIPPVPREKLNISWESDEEIFERGYRSTPIKPLDRPLSFEIPLNIKPFCRRVRQEPVDAIPVDESIVKQEKRTGSEERRLKENKKSRSKDNRSPYLDSKNELKLLQQERHNLSEERRKLELQKMRIKELELKTIKKVEEQLLERGSKRKRSRNRESDLDWINEDSGTRKGKGKGKRKEKHGHVIDLTAVKMEKFVDLDNSLSVSSGLDVSLGSIKSPSVLENEYEEFLKAVTTNLPKKKHDISISSTESSSSDDSSDSSSSDSSPRAVKKTKLNLFPVPKGVVIANLDDLLPKPPVEPQELSVKEQEAPVKEQTVLQDIVAPLPIVDTKNPMPVPSPSLCVDATKLPPFVNLGISPELGSASSPSPTKKSDAFLGNFTSPLTDISVDSFSFDEKSPLDNQRLKPFVFTSMVLPSKKLLFNSKLNFDDDSEEEKERRAAKLSFEMQKKPEEAKAVAEPEVKVALEEKPKDKSKEPEKKATTSKNSPSKNSPSKNSPAKNSPSKNSSKSSTAKKSPDVSKRLKGGGKSKIDEKKSVRKLSPKRRRDSPIRRRSPRRRSPIRRRSPLGRRNYSPRRRGSISPIRNRRRFSVSPRRKPSRKRSLSPGRSPLRKKMSRSPDKFIGRNKSPLPVNSPMDGLKTSVADSTISDDLLPQPAMVEDYESPMAAFFERIGHTESPKRVPLDDRINEVLGLKEQQQQQQHLQQQQLLKQVPTIYSNYNYSQPYAQHYNHYVCREYKGIPVPPPPIKKAPNKVVQVGNMLQIVPTEDFATPPPVISTPAPPPVVHRQETMQKILQVGNMLQIVPGRLPPEMPVYDLPPQEKAVVVVAATTPEVPVAVIAEKQSAEAVMKLKAAERRAEREKRRMERERRRKEKEKRRKEKERQKQIKLKIRTENMIKKALDLEEENEMVFEEEEEEEVVLKGDVGQWPPAAPGLPAAFKEAGKSILIKSGFRSEHVEERLEKKFVQFADGVRPGEGTSPSGGEELSSPPPASAKLPKEKRYKKTKVPKKSKKKKIKVKVIKKQQHHQPQQQQHQQQHYENDDSDEDEHLPPPPPPPGSPPPHLFPPRIKTRTINNIHPSFVQNIVGLPPVQNSQTNFSALYRPPIPIIMPPHPPPTHCPPRCPQDHQHHHDPHHQHCEPGHHHCEPPHHHHEEPHHHHEPPHHHHHEEPHHHHHHEEPHHHHEPPHHHHH